MQTPATLVFVSMVTGEVTELDVSTLEDAGYKVRVKHAAALHAGNRSEVPPD